MTAVSPETLRGETEPCARTGKRFENGQPDPRPGALANLNSYARGRPSCPLCFPERGAEGLHRPPRCEEGGNRGLIGWLRNEALTGHAPVQCFRRRDWCRVGPEVTFPTCAGLTRPHHYTRINTSRGMWSVTCAWHVTEASKDAQSAKVRREGRQARLGRFALCRGVAAPEALTGSVPFATLAKIRRDGIYKPRSPHNRL